MAISEVAVALHGGPLAVNVTDAVNPQSVTGVVWHYDPTKVPIGAVGEFATEHPEVALGDPTALNGHYFQVEGTVLQFGDDPPSPFQVTVTVRQNEAVVHLEVAATGSIGSENVPFSYPFRVVAQ